MAMPSTQIVKETYDAFNREDFAAMASHLDEKCSWNVAGPTEIPWAGHFEGPEEIRGYAETLTQTVDFEEFTPRLFVEQDNTVIVQGAEKCVVEKTGKHYVNEWLHVFKVNDGKITYFQEYQDTADIVRALT